MNQPLTRHAARATSAAPLLRADRVSVRHGSRLAVDGVSLSLGEGEIVTIIGPNGGGKSTLLRALIGAAPLSAGAVSRRDGLRIGFMPQKLSLDRTMPLTVERFLSLAGGAGRDPAKRRGTLARVGVAALGGAQIAELSGGELQRALLARALLRKPHLLALDEPTQGLDHRGAARFYQLIEDVRAEQGLGVLLVSHDLHVVMAASNRVLCLNGHVCCEGAPQQVTAHPAYRAMFGAGLGAAADALGLYGHLHDHDHDAACGGTSGPAGPSCGDVDPRRRA